MSIVNTNVLKHPMNWLVIWSMLLVAFFVGHLLISYFNGKHPGSSNAAGPGTTSEANPQ